MFGEVLTEEATTCPTAKYATDRRCSQHNHDALTYFRQRTNTQLNLVIADILLSLKCLIARRLTERTRDRSWSDKPMVVVPALLALIDRICWEKVEWLV